jgi:hypothetical protein
VKYRSPRANVVTASPDDIHALFPPESCFQEGATCFRSASVHPSPMQRVGLSRSLMEIEFDRGTPSRSSWRMTYPSRSRSQRTVRSGCARWERISAANKAAAHRNSRDLPLSSKNSTTRVFGSCRFRQNKSPLDFYFNYNDPSGAPVAAVLARLRLVSINRFRRDIYVLPAALLREVRARLRAFLS